MNTHSSKQGFLLLKLKRAFHVPHIHTQPSFFSALLSPCSRLKTKGLCSALLSIRMHAHASFSQRGGSLSVRGLDKEEVLG